MIRVTYEIRHDDTDQVEDVVVKNFKDKNDKDNWEGKQLGHPFLHLRQVSSEQVED